MVLVYVGSWGSGGKSQRQYEKKATRSMGSLRGFFSEWKK